MKRNGFPLIELLVVVAIIGILAAVGVVAYNGYTSSAKRNAIKSNFKLVEKYVLAELMKCEIGHTEVFTNAGSKKLNCGGIQDSWRTANAMYFDPSLKFLNPIDNGVWNRDRQIAVRNDVYKGSSIPDNMIGYFFLNSKAWPISTRSCFETPCSNTDNVLTSSINYQ